MCVVCACVCSVYALPYVINPPPMAGGRLIYIKDSTAAKAATEANKQQLKDGVKALREVVIFMR